MYDEKLVRAAQDGDDAAFAAIYDRCADAVHDLCWSLIGDAAEAARIVEETFVLAVRHLGELGDPAQVRAWLLAIARDRIIIEDEQGTLRTGWGAERAGGGEGMHADPSAPLGTVALRAWTARAAAVLALTDQAVLELELRHHLESYQLAAALGCAEEAVSSITSRVKAEAEHVLGALVVARQARRDCPELEAALAGWDGVPTAEIADVVDAHSSACDRCSRRRALVNPLELISAAPIAAAPSALRNQVLDLSAAELAEHRTMGAMASGAAVGSAAASESGAPTVTTEVARRRPIAPLLAIAAAAAVLAGALILVLRSPSHPQTAAAVRPGVVNIVPESTAPALSPTTVVASLAPLTTTTSTSTTTAPAGRLELNASQVDFGADATTAQITLRNSGTGAVDWSGSSGAGWLSLTPASGHLSSAGAVSVTLALDRRVAPRGPFEIRVAFQPADQSQSAASLLAVGSATGPTTTSSSTTTSSTSTTTAGGPVITAVSADPSAVSAAPCTPDTSAVSATVTDPATVSSVVMTFTLADGRQGTTALSQNSGSSTWSGTLGPATRPGTDTFEIVATDSTGATRTSDPVSVTVAACH